MPHDEMSTEDMATAQAMNGGLPAAPVNGYIPAVPTMQSVTVTTTPHTNGTHTAASTAPVPVTSTPESTGDYKAYVLNVQSTWPPPLFARPNLRPEERFYLENRWHSQWSFYDKKANESKKSYLRLQQIIVIGSVIVPVLIASGPYLASVIPADSSGTQDVFRFFIDFATIIISTAVAGAAAIEGLYKYGDSWTSYRRAAEEMQQEKFMFDVRSGRYANNPDAFSRFVERCEEIMAQQNGNFIHTIERQQAQAQEQASEILAKYRSDSDDNATTVTVSSPTSTVAVETTSSSPVSVVEVVEDSAAG